MAALEELLAEQLRYREALERIGQHLQGLAEDPSFHIHLEALEARRELVRSRVFPEPPAG